MKATRKPMPIMAHMIPFFPDLPRSHRVARALIDGGARYLEIQFPYSDPTADGPDIQGAGAQALARGFTVRAGWDFIASLREGDGSPEQTPLFVMGYAGLVFAHGIDRFVARAAELGVEGVIVPDLPLDSDEGLLEAGARHGVNIVPVIALGAAPHRVALVHEARTRYIYASLRRGITGSHTDIGEENIAFMEELGSRGARVLAGFGVATAEQVRAVTGHAHAAVVGSAFVRALRALEQEADNAKADPADHDPDPYGRVRALVERLTGLEERNSPD